jgi:hypothetical protein
MRSITSTEPRFAAPDSAVCADTVPSTILAQSALQLTRAAIARWSGGNRPAGAPVRTQPRVSPQARWLAQAQYGLAEWIARGGFSQDESATTTLPAPVMRDACAAIDTPSDACID